MQELKSGKAEEECCRILWTRYQKIIDTKDEKKIGKFDRTKEFLLINILDSSYELATNTRPVTDNISPRRYVFLEEKLWLAGKTRSSNPKLNKAFINSRQGAAGLEAATAYAGFTFFLPEKKVQPAAF